MRGPQVARETLSSVARHQGSYPDYRRNFSERLVFIWWEPTRPASASYQSRQRLSKEESTSVLTRCLPAA